jgi:hypothetical protein
MPAIWDVKVAEVFTNISDLRLGEAGGFSKYAL